MSVPSRRIQGLLEVSVPEGSGLAGSVFELKFGL